MLNNVAKTKDTASIREPAPGADFKPVDMLHITTLEQLKAISDPLRLDILELIAKEARTVKQVAAALKQPATKLYYHMNELEANGYATLVGTRVKSGIVEKYYRASAEGIHVDRSLLNAGETQGESLNVVMSAVFDATMTDLARGFRAGRFTELLEAKEGQPRTMMLSHDLCRLHPEEVPAFIAKISALMEEMGRREDEPGLVTYTFTVAFFPHSLPDRDINGNE